MAEIIRRGIDAYRQTMKPSGNAPSGNAPFGAPPPPPNEKKPLPSGKTGEKNPPGGKTTDLLKTVTTPKPAKPAPPPQPQVPESKTRRVAKFLMLIGSDHAAKILSELDSNQIEEISREIASIRGVGREEAEAIIAEFRSLLSGSFLYSGPSSGGVETARRMLTAAFGPEKAEAFIQKTIPNLPENIFGFLEEFTPEQIVFLLKDENPATAALVLARLSPNVTAKALGKLSPALKPEILIRIAHQSEVMPEVLERVAAVMRERARHLGSGGANDIEIDGMGALAAILKKGDYSFGDRIINELETESPAIGKSLKDKLYTLNDVVDAFDKPLAEKLRTMAEKDIALLLKGRSGAFREKILSNVSSHRRTIIREEDEIMGPVARRECDEAAGDFLAWFRQARENGDMALKSDEDWVD